MDELAALLDLQHGVIARRQARAVGLSPTDIARRVRRREWTRVHPGVYVNHSGPLTWWQRAWAAVLACWPAALDGRSALRAHEGPGRRSARDDDPIEVVVAHGRRVSAPHGVQVRQSRRFDDATQANFAPPRLRYDAVVIDLADRAEDDLTAIAILADACGGRRTTAARLRAQVDGLARVRRRVWLVGILNDVADGACSVLEHGFLNLVERPHGLPRGQRQVPATDAAGRLMFRDVCYDVGGHRQIVELDGRLGHTSARDRARDLERDLDAALGREHTVRLGYTQVFGDPCVTAAKVGRLLRARGWTGVVRPCASCPPPAQRSGGDQPA
ncbi:type IV toxin-antitoxin system AbiEi family antitoxin domain-containing protein [Nocardioides sp. BGMRC 2183]|nr:type IV toxin-antitoxin system AbiEi family antitoxin domain-containing protein [Nocardioides sp. BGMRC 2183]